MLRKTLFTLFAAIAVLTSCKQDNTLRYNNLTMGNVVRGVFTSDQGNIFHVVEQNCQGNLASMDRALVLCDVIERVPNKENEYNIRLHSMVSVDTKRPITTTEAEMSPSTMTDDPVHIDQLWVSGGYINMYVAAEIKTAAKLDNHLFNLVINESESSAGKYVLNLRHNSMGESLIYNPTDTGILLGGKYLSFPISDFVKEESAKITINWKWYKSAGQGWSSETQDNNYTLSYTKGGLEQAPATFSQKANNLYN